MTRTPRLLPLLATALLVACASAPAPAPQAVAAASAATDAAPQPPVANRVPYLVRSPHGDREDPYYWLRDDSRSDPQVLSHLNAENAWTDAVLAPLAGFRDALYQEIVGRIRQDDSTVPFRWRGDWYYSRYEEGREYPIHARRSGSLEAPEEVLLDLNRLAEGHGFYQVGTFELSPDRQLLAYAEDSVGRRQYVLRIKDLRTGELLPDAIGNVSPNVVWSNDSRSLLYVEKDPVTLLTRRVKRHRLGTPVDADELLYEEPDESFYMGVMRTRSDRWLCIVVGSTVSSEQRCADADDPVQFRLLAPRQRDLEYRADHLDGRWVLLTNWEAPNFRLMEVDDARAFDGRDGWRERIAHDPRVFLHGFELFDRFLVLSERSDGLRRLRVLPESGEPSFVAADEPAYAMYLSTNAEPGTSWLRYSYTSLTTPTTIYELDVATGERRLLKQDPVLGGFDPSDYVTERSVATATDGTGVPVSLVYRRGVPKDGSAPLYLAGYGSYGSSSDPVFNAARLSLLDRGVVYAIAHVRGGQELGRAWYEQGKLLDKKNTFTDFIAVRDHLVQAGCAAPGRIAAAGGSAGGLLIGAVANMAPAKFDVLVAKVPFVDVVTTMLDASIPLTTNEYDEWGNPAEKAYYDYMVSYSPYDNVRAQDYPALYVSTGLWDSQVQYFEPAKWVAKLRASKTDAKPLLFRINMEAGHGGKSGRFQRYRELAEEYAFVLDRLGARDHLPVP